MPPLLSYLYFTIKRNRGLKKRCKKSLKTKEHMKFKHQSMSSINQIGPYMAIRPPNLVKIEDIKEFHLQQLAQSRLLMDL